MKLKPPKKDALIFACIAAALLNLVTGGSAGVTLAGYAFLVFVVLSLPEPVSLRIENNETP